MAENVRTKTDRLLLEGRVVVTHIHAHEVSATIRGEGAIHHAGWTPSSGWLCTCPARGETCSHIAALKRITAVDLEPTPTRRTR